jgi:hypothetical protein
MNADRCRNLARQIECILCELIETFINTTCVADMVALMKINSRIWGSHGGDYEMKDLFGCNVVQLGDSPNASKDHIATIFRMEV